MMKRMLIFPDWNSVDSVRKAHTDLEAVALLFFALLVVAEAISHSARRKRTKHVFDTFGIWFFAVAVLCEIAGFRYGERNDELSAGVIASLDQIAKDAAAKAGTASDRSMDAEGKAATAANDATGAITNAAKANAQAAAADASALRAQTKLEQLRRSLADRSLTEAQRRLILASVKGSTPVLLTINHLGNDAEGGRFAEKIGAVLSQAGWKPDYVGNTYYYAGEPTKSSLSVTGDEATTTTAKRLAAGLNAAGIPTNFEVAPNTFSRNYITIDLTRNQAGAGLLRRGNKP